MNFILITIGSHGDVHPFVGMGKELLKRGHQATLITNPHFEPLVRGVGLDFVGIGSADEYRTLVRHPDLWHRKRAFKVIFDSIVGSLPEVFDAVMGQVNVTPDPIVVSSSLCLGVRVAQDKAVADGKPFPMATVHLAPAVFRSIHEPPTMPGLFMPPWLPMWIKTKMWEGGDKFVLDPVIAPGLNAFRVEKGLPPISRIAHEWWHSPDLTIGLFPDWFAKVQPDWPKQTRLAGFPLYDEADLEPLSADLRAFLDDGDKPIAFTPGSAMWDGEHFFASAADACRRLERRGLLLSRHHEHIPAKLPKGVIHVPYAPFSALLPRAAAMVHHGGIGTTSQALAAGVPQLIMNMAHDQLDNATRCVKLGVAQNITPKRFTGRNVAAALKKLLSDPNVASNCASIAKKFEGVNGIANACVLLEGMRAKLAARV